MERLPGQEDEFEDEQQEGDEDEQDQNSSSTTIRDMRAKMRDQNKSRRQAEKEAADARKRLAELEGQVRANQLRGVFAAVGAPEGLIGLYPAEAEVSEEQVREFLSGVGYNPNAAAWADYENQAPSNGLPPRPAGDLESRLAIEMKKNQRAVRSLVPRNDLSLTYYPTRKETDEWAEFKAEVDGLHEGWEQDVAAGRMAPIFENGYGGRLDPPPYAVNLETRQAAPVRGL